MSHEHCQREKDIQMTFLGAWLLKDAGNPTQRQGLSDGLAQLALFHLLFWWLAPDVRNKSQALVVRLHLWCRQATHEILTCAVSSDLWGPARQGTSWEAEPTKELMVCMNSWHSRATFSQIMEFLRLCLDQKALYCQVVRIDQTLFSHNQHLFPLPSTTYIVNPTT